MHFIWYIENETLRLLWLSFLSFVCIYMFFEHMQRSSAACFRFQAISSFFQNISKIINTWTEIFTTFVPIQWIRKEISSWDIVNLFSSDRIVVDTFVRKALHSHIGILSPAFVTFELASLQVCRRRAIILCLIVTNVWTRTLPVIYYCH